MAVDQALAESVAAGGAPFLRFYAWDPGTLSLGRFQHPRDGLGAAAATVPRVRRLTGGGAIWHEQELTYSLGCAPGDLPDRGVKASFELLCGFLLDAWRGLGWKARFAKDAPASGEALGRYTPACFAGHEAYDILVDDRKLGGNAQRRERTQIFQHGSLPLVLDHGRLDALFLPGFRPDPDQVTDLRRCGWSGSVAGLEELLVRAFAERLDVELVPSELSPAEKERSRACQRGRYADTGWTEDGGGSLRQAVGGR